MDCSSLAFCQRPKSKFAAFLPEAASRPFCTVDHSAFFLWREFRRRLRVGWDDVFAMVRLCDPSE
jgi:hypothetical protein